MIAGRPTAPRAACTPTTRWDCSRDHGPVGRMPPLQQHTPPRPPRTPPQTGLANPYSATSRRPGTALLLYLASATSTIRSAVACQKSNRPRPLNACVRAGRSSAERRIAPWKWRAAGAPRDRPATRGSSAAHAARTARRSMASASHGPSRPHSTAHPVRAPSTTGTPARTPTGQPPRGHQPHRTPAQSPGSSPAPSERRRWREQPSERAAPWLRNACQSTYNVTRPGKESQLGVAYQHTGRTVDATAPERGQPKSRPTRAPEPQAIREAIRRFAERGIVDA